MFILKKRHQPGVYVPLRALFLALHASFSSADFFQNYLSVDLTKGSFGHFSSFLCNQKFKKCLKFQYFACSYKTVKFFVTCNTIKDAIISDKTK